MKPKFTSSEKKSIFGISLVLSSRMLGLSLLLPVLSIYVYGMGEATPFLVGLTVGAYGLTQAIFQVPFGLMSDKYGRKLMILIGLVMFAIGSIVAALTDDIYILLCARFLQGSGAIASSCLAWIADTTNEKFRNTSMAVIGMSIGMSITLGLILGPLIGGTWDVRYLFWICLFLALISIIYVSIFMKTPCSTDAMTVKAENPSFSHWSDVIKSNGLWKLDLCGFIKNLCMTSVFFAVPLVLKRHYHMAHMWKIYVPMTILGLLVMRACAKQADKGYAKQFLVLGFAFITVSVGIIAFSEDHLTRLLCGFFTYYVGIAILEPILPSAVSKLAPANYTGTTLGVFNMSQYFGTFCGGILAGTLISTGFEHLFFALSIAAFIATIIAGFSQTSRTGTALPQDVDG
ncbi:MAG: MFS transporter [Candidatus Anammoxibacter sp.]